MAANCHLSPRPRARRSGRFCLAGGAFLFDPRSTRSMFVFPRVEDPSDPLAMDKEGKTPRQSRAAATTTGIPRANRRALKLTHPIITSYSVGASPRGGATSRPARVFRLALGVIGAVPKSGLP